MKTVMNGAEITKQSISDLNDYIVMENNRLMENLSKINAGFVIDQKLMREEISEINKRNDKDVK
jgi:hypothetical protein